MFSSIWSESPIGHIQDLSTEILDMSSSLSKKGRDAFRVLYLQCAEEVATLAYTLLSPDFSWNNYHSALGGKTLVELNHFSSDVLDLVRINKDAPGLEDWDHCETKARIAKSGIPEQAADEIIRLAHSLGHFPVAAFALAWISSRVERDGYIYRHGFSIWKDSQVKSLAEMADHLGITRERCRQIRNQLLDNLVSFFNGITLAGQCSYDYLDKELDSLVNEQEGTSFSIHFIRFILGSLYDTLSVVGNMEESLLPKVKGGTDDIFLAAIPCSLASAFDFNSFLNDISSKNNEKRTETQVMVMPEWSQEAKAMALTLASLRYGWTEENGSLVIPPNENKNRSDIMEDIIRDAGHPLSIEEIASEYARRYPDREADPAKIRGNMQVNPRIVPIGRTGVYSLVEWTSGTSRGGTIRSFVMEYLDNSESHIVPTKDVYEYVRRFRPNSSDENIRSNLMLDSEKPYRVIWKDGVSYLSYSVEDIPEGYKQVFRAYSEKRSFAESISLVDEFISRYGRLPVVCQDPEQTRLAQFLTNQYSLRRRGLLDEKKLEALSRIESMVKDDAVQLDLF